MVRPNSSLSRRRAWGGLPLLSVIGMIGTVAALVLGSALPTRANDDPPAPINPSRGEAELLEIINKLPLNDIDKALDRFPVPYVVVASAGGASPTIKNNRAGAPTRVDADNSLLTGKGGHDIEVEVNTELTPEPHLRLTINRLGSGLLAQDLSVVVAFPFDAFNGEDASPDGGNPNLFFGYQTTAAFDGTDYPAGGSAPESLEYRFVPGTLAGTDHLFNLGIDTVNAPNPVRYIAGHFDGTADLGIQDALGMAALADPVPASVDLAVDVAESPTSEAASSATDSQLELSWTASAPSKVIFDYLESEDFPFTIPEFNSTLTVDQMPTSEVLSLRLNEGDDTNGLTLGHRANAEIAEVTFLKERSDGLMIRGTAAQVPTEVDLTGDLDGGLSLDVNAHTLDLGLDVAQAGGFLDTDGFLGYDAGLLHLGVRDAPDLTAALDPGNDRYEAEASNPGESIGSVELALDDGPVAVIGGKVDIDGDDDIDASDDGPLGLAEAVDGGVDLDGDGDADGDDDGALAGSVPAVSVVDGGVDLDGDGAADGSDDGNVSVLALPPAWSEEPPRHVLSLVDDGSAGTIAARLVNLSAGKLDLDGPKVIDGELDLDGNDLVDGADDGTLSFDIAVIDGRVDLDNSGAPDASDDGQLFGTFGPPVFDGRIDIDANGAANSSDDGGLTTQAFGIGTSAASPLQSLVSTKETSTLVPGRDVNATCTVEDIPAGDIDFRVALPPPAVSFGYEANPPQGIDSVGCSGHVGTLLFETEFSDLPAVMNFDFIADKHFTLVAEDGTGPNTGTLGSGSLRLCDDTDLDSVCEESDSATGAGIPGTTALFGSGNPLRDAQFRIDQTPSFEGRWRVGDVAVIDGGVDVNADGVVDANDDAADDGTFGEATIGDGFVDVNRDGVVNGSDDGRFLGKRVVDARIDVDGDGDADGSDDGTVSGSAVSYDTGLPDASLFLDGAQLSVATVAGLDPLSAASPTADHFARFTDEGAGGKKGFDAGVFGIDEFTYSADDASRTVALHYGANESHGLNLSVDSGFGGAYFEDYDVDLALTIADVPQTFDLFTDLATELTYTGSSEIDAVDLVGTIDDTDDAADNGTDVDLQLDGLPSQVAFNLAGDITKVIDGVLDVNGGGVGAGDDAVLAGVRVIDGRLDLNGSGAADGSDDGFFVGVPVFDGLVDANESGGVNGDDDGAVAGATLNMSDQLDRISLELSSDNKIIGTDYRLAEVGITTIPARWAVNWGGGRFLLESKDAGGNRAPMGVLSAVVSTSNDAATNAAQREPFTLDGASPGGAVLGAPGAAGGCRVNYSAFAQEVDKRYYNAAPDADPSGVFDRLRELYCDSEQLDAAEDHAVARMGTVDGQDALEYGSLQFTGFQRVSWVPDANGGQFIFRAPTPGAHPLFAGYESDDEFTTVQVGNIPDEVVVDIDTTEHATYDATDDTDADFGEIDLYTGPLPTAQDGQEATRAVIRHAPGATDADPQHDFIHTGWKFGFPSGGAFLDNSEEIEVLLLTQSADFRITGGLALEDLLAAYAIELFSFDVNDSLCIVPDPFGGCIVEIPVAWELFEAKAGVVNDADGFVPGSLVGLNPAAITPDPAKPDVAGFLGVYMRRNDVQPTDTGVSPVGNTDYVPLITAEEEGFRGATAGLTVNLDPLDADILVFSIDASFTMTGDLVFDFWSPFDTVFTDDDAIPVIDEVGFENRPDYTNNSPFHILPGIESPISNADFDNVHDLVYTFNGWHGFADHFDPFAP